MPSNIQAECVRCPHSLVVRADTLKEVLDILLAHVKNQQNKHNNEPAPTTYSGIVSSDWFQWTVTDVMPYEKLLKIPAGP